MSPTAATPGQQVSLHGSGFSTMGWDVRLELTPAPNYLFGVTVPYTIVSDTRIDFTVPSGAHTGPVRLTRKVYVFSFWGGTKIQTVASGPTLTIATPPAAPSNLQAYPISSDVISLLWQDNSSNEQAFTLQIRVPGGAWTTMGTVAANQISEPITGLNALTGYEFRVAAVGASGNSGWSNVAAATTLRATTVTITTGATVPSPMFPGVASVTSAGLYIDANNNGIVDGAPDQAPNHAGNVFPRFPVQANTSAGYQLAAGSRYLQGSNAVLILDVRTWTTMNRPQFVAVYFNIANGGVQPVGMMAGDWANQTPGGQGIVMGSNATPSNGFITGSLPSGNSPGSLEGTVSGNVFFSAPGGTTYGAWIDIAFGQAFQNF